MPRARPWTTSVAASAVAVLMICSASAGTQHVLVGLDGKTFFEPAGSRNGPDGHDAVAVLDASDPARPVLTATLPLPNSVYGPPSNLSITPDGRLGLVASSIVMRADGPNWWAEPDDRLHVIDLGATPPRLVETIRVGRQPSGIAIAPSGELALVANRAGKSVSVLAIAGGTVRHLGEVSVADEAAAIAIAPDGRQALVAKNAAGKVGVLAIEGTRVTYDPALDMPVGSGVYAVAMTPDGRLALTANTGLAPSDGHADTVSVIRAEGALPRVIDHLGVGDTPETLALSPDGRHAVVVVVRGSAAPHDSPAYTRNGELVLLAIGPERATRVVHSAEVGAVPEGVAFGPDGRHVYVGNYVDRTVQVFVLEDERLRDTGYLLGLPGQPASMGGAVRR